MAQYRPTTIAYQKEGLVKDRDAFVLANDAYAELTNMYEWRGRLRRRPGYQFLGRLRRDITYAPGAAANPLAVTDILNSAGERATQPNATLQPGKVVVTLDAGPNVFTDDSDGGFTKTSGPSTTLYAAQAINGITNAASAVITLAAGHQFQINDRVRIRGVSGMTEINERLATVTAIAATTITVNIASTAFSAWTSGGTVDGCFVNYETGELHLRFNTATYAGGNVSYGLGYFPALPCMGLPTKEERDVNAEVTYAFDTRFAYVYNNSGQQFQELTSATPTTWQGTDSDFFWSMNYWQTSDDIPYFWATNFNAEALTPDPIRIYDGIDWYTFAPTVNGANEMHQCLILVSYKGRVVALNTYEGSTLALSIQYPKRARWCQLGAPLSAVAAGVAPTATVEWRDDIPGRGGYVDAPTNEHIVSAYFIRDLLVVGFEHSTWALRYTGNEILPFVWDRINVELGTEATFSMVGFDKGILAIGDKAITSCDGNGVERIDDEIPDEVFEISNSVSPSSALSDGPRRVHGIRDFYERMVYWTIPRASTEAKFPDSLLVFNYQNQTWSVWEDSFTCLGKYQMFNDQTWASLYNITWQEANFPWVTAKLQSQFPGICAGNQQGWVEVLAKQVDNDASLEISGVTGGTPVSLQVINHNLQDGYFVRVDGIIGTGASELNDRIFLVYRTDADNITLEAPPRFAITAITRATQAVVTATGHNFDVGDHWYIDQVSGMTQINGMNGYVVAVSGNTVTLNINSSTFSVYTSGGYVQNTDSTPMPVTVVQRTYMGGGSLSIVMGFEARSKKFNSLETGNKLKMGWVDVLTNSTDGGEISVPIFVDYQDATPVNSQVNSYANQVISTQVSGGDTVGTSKTWHRMYCQAYGQFIQYMFTLNTRQMFTPNIVNSDVAVHGIVLWTNETGRLVQ